MKKIKILSSSNFAVFLISMLCLGAFYPFIYNKFLFGDSNTVISLGFIGIWLLLLILFVNKSQIRSINKYFFLICLIQIFCFLIFTLFFQSSSYLKGIIYIGLSLIFIFLLVNTIEIKKWLNYFTKFNIILLVLSVIGIVLLSGGYLQQIGESFTGTNGRVFSYYGFFFMLVSEGGNFMRQSGYYDEPGSFAYVVMFLLLLNRKYFKNQIWEYTLLVLTLFTASLAHIVTSLAFILIFNFSNNKIKYFFAIAISVIILAFLLEQYAYKNEHINYLRSSTIGRLEYVYLEGEERGSRSEGYKIGSEIFKSHKFGIPRDEVEERYPDFIHETIWGPILYYGILGTPIFFLPFIYIFYRSINKRRNIFDLKCLLLITLNLFQRPSYMYPLFMICIYILFFNSEEDDVAVGENLKSNNYKKINNFPNQRIHNRIPKIIFKKYFKWKKNV